MVYVKVFEDKRRVQDSSRSIHFLPCCKYFFLKCNSHIVQEPATEVFTPFLTKGLTT